LGCEVLTFFNGKQGVIVHFSKYHGTGNDFIMIDGRSQETSHFSTKLIRKLCDRRFGVGGDGLILLEKTDRADFKMRYFNADGNEGSMCGNGGRCIFAFAFHLGIIGSEASFEGIDGMHSANLLPDGEIRVKLKDVHGIKLEEDGYLIDTGSPHFVKFVKELDQLDVASVGKEIRHQARFGKGGVNVNFVEMGSGSEAIYVRTFERGVEAETFSCGTGVTASAICAYYQNKTDNITYPVQTRGGRLNVSFRPHNYKHFTDVYLTGPAVPVFKGSIEIKK